MSKAPKYYGRFSTKRDFMAAVRAANTGEGKHYFDRSTVRLFKDSTYDVESSGIPGFEWMWVTYNRQGRSKRLIHPVTLEFQCWPDWRIRDNRWEGFYTAEDLLSRPTIQAGHYDNLKIETEDTRVWLSRMTVEDGAKYNNGVTVSKLVNGVWVNVLEYEG